MDWKLSGCPENIVETLVAFANDLEEAGGGSVLCGVQEAEGVATIVGIAHSEVKRLKNRIFELSRRLAVPSIEPRFDTFLMDNEKQVLIVRMDASSEVHTFKKHVFIRLGDKTVQASLAQQTALVQRKTGTSWLEQPCPDATLADINPFALLDLSKGRIPDGRMERYLEPGYRMFGSVPPLTERIQRPSGTETVPKRFAMLLAGKEPERFLPGAFVKLTHFQGLTRADSVFATQEFFGPISLIVQKVMAKFEQEASLIVDKTKDFLSGAQNRRRYSISALQEILVNALVHRDYQNP